jgi:hypothetical protein
MLWTFALVCSAPERWLFLPPCHWYCFAPLLCRPVILVGLFTRPTSVDLGMAVNQLNATAQHASVVWQSLILENAGPGARVVQQQMQQQLLQSNSSSRAVDCAVTASPAKCCTCLYVLACSSTHEPA